MTYLDTTPAVKLPKKVRRALRVLDASQVTFVRTVRGVFLVPEDPVIRRLVERSEAALKAKGRTPRQVLAQLERSRKKLVAERYGYKT